MTAPQSAMPLHPTAEVSEDAEPLVDGCGVVMAPHETESLYSKNLRLIAENTVLRLRIMALEDELAKTRKP